jgi:uncharacterized protein YjiK
MDGLILTEEDIMNQIPTETDKEQEQVDYLQNNEFTLRRICGQTLEILAKYTLSI